MGKRRPRLSYLTCNSPPSIKSHARKQKLLNKSSHLWFQTMFFFNPPASEENNATNAFIRPDFQSKLPVYSTTHLCSFLSSLSKCKYLFLLITQMSKYTKKYSLFGIPLILKMACQHIIILRFAFSAELQQVSNICIQF